MRVPHPPTWLVRCAQVVAAIAAVTLVAGVVVAGRGSIDLHDPVRDGRVVRPPDWTRPCYTASAREDRELLRLCARVEGRVLWVQKDMPGEYHFAVLSRLHLFVVKSDRPQPRLAMVTAVGPLVRASNGMREVEAVTVVRD